MRHDHSIIACSRHVYMGVVLRAHPVRGESHIQPNANGEVVTNKKHKAGAFQSTVKHRCGFRGISNIDFSIL